MATEITPAMLTLALMHRIARDIQIGLPVNLITPLVRMLKTPPISTAQETHTPGMT